MATDRQRAARDLNSKLRLEARLRPSIRRAIRDLSLEIAGTFNATGTLPNVQALSAGELEPVLRGHYDLVARTFSDRIRGEMPPGSEMSAEEAAAVTAALSRFFDFRAPQQAAQIGVTNEADAVESLDLAGQEAARRFEEDGELTTRRETALVLGTFFTRRALGRVNRITSLETQVPAEASKMTEVDVLLGQVPSVLADPISAPKSLAVKEWVSQGDSRVRTPPNSRFDHLRVDSAQVPANRPFVVSGEQLMYPGDTSLGASSGNVVNCRCSTVHDVDAIASARQ